MQFIKQSDIELVVGLEYVQTYFPTANTFDSFEAIAISEAKSYLLSANVDIAKLFTMPPLFDKAKNYEAGELVTYNSQTFYCLKQSFWKLPSESEFWALQDPRHSYLVLVLVNIMVYHATMQLSVHTLSEARTKAYEDAKKWLSDVANGRVQLNTLPINEEKKPTVFFFSSNVPKLPM